MNGEFLHNELITMPIDPATDEEKLIDINGRFGRSKGHSLYDFYIREWAGVDPADGGSRSDSHRGELPLPLLTTLAGVGRGSPMPHKSRLQTKTSPKIGS